jgi:SAM-dependent methyltransferase
LAEAQKVGGEHVGTLSTADRRLTADTTADEYTLRLAALPGVFLNKVLFHQPSLSGAAPLASPAAYNTYGFRVDSVLSTSRLSRIPLPNSSVDVISARSLHKTIHAGGGLAADPAEDLRGCLEECHRILVPGGRLEYIYFGDKLLACGPLTGELEPFLGEVWTENSTRAYGQIFPDTNDFLDLLEQVGFKDRSHRSIKFGLFTLRSLYDHRGMPRSSAGAGTSPTALTAQQQQQQLGAQHRPAPPCTPGPGSYIDEKAWELLFRVHAECTLRETGWKCVIGYATKRVERAR